jgi:glycerol-3-phosphate dehydrogenase (NAD(P)+)
MNIAIIGTGAYSLSMAKRLAKNKENNIILWTEDPKKEKEFKDNKKIKSVFKDEVFADNISVSNDYSVVMNNANVIYLMTTTKYVKSTLENIKPFYKKKTPIIIGTKGIEIESEKFISQLVKEILKTKYIAVIAGPSFAIDILNDEILALTVATRKRSIFNLLKNIYHNSRTILKKSNDLIGVELCSTLKNIYAIGSGILNGLGNANGANAVYLTKVMKEVYDILYMFDRSEYTFLSLAGLGDILMTCSDNKSRNYTYGTKLTSKTKTTAANFLKKNTVEGYETIDTMYKILKKRKTKAKLLFTIYEIIYENKNPKELENELLK